MTALQRSAAVLAAVKDADRRLARIEAASLAKVAACGGLASRGGGLVCAVLAASGLAAAAAAVLGL